MKRFDKGYIFYHLLTDFFISLFFVFYFASEFFFILEEETEEIIGVNFGAIPYVIIIFIAIYALFTAYRIFYQRTSGYALTEKDIRCKRGVLFRKNSMIEYTRIHAINKKQNIFHKIFGIAVLTVDSGSANTGHQAEITVIERTATVDALLSELRVLREGGVKSSDEGEKKPEILLSEKDPLYKFTSPKKFLYSLINIASAAFFTGAYILLSALLIGVCRAVLRLDFLGTFGQYVMWAAIILIGAMILVSIFTFIGTVIQSFVTYYNFKIEKRDNDIVISFGLLERHENTFSYDRIRGVKITQGLIQRALGFAGITLEVIGYMNESDSNNAVSLGVLVPFCRIEEVDEILAKILPEYTPTKKQTKSPKLFPHLSWFTLILAISSALVTVSAVVPMTILGAGAYATGIVVSVICIATLIIFLTKLCSAFLAYKTAGIAIDGEKITTYNGGFTKQITVMKTRDLSSVEQVATPMQKKAGITSAVLHMRTNALTNEVKVLHQTTEAVATLTEAMPR